MCYSVAAYLLELENLSYVYLRVSIDKVNGLRESPR